MKVAKRGKPAPAEDRKMLFAANAEAALVEATVSHDLTC
jgi:hypothetical protein